MPKRMPEETKQRAVRLVLYHLDEYPNLTVACETVSQRLGFGAESLRRWVRQAQVDTGERHGVTWSESERMRRLERENRELREANAMEPPGFPRSTNPARDFHNLCVNLPQAPILPLP